ncbi:hypothetical protein AMECASPLE_023332 [Ameca splendens]|uniref:Uncharacterized protein n=1 Tax=Ameca splendens TaxID=208324 RepID=A0ABV0ZZM8_9TELE
MQVHLKLAASCLDDYLAQVISKPCLTLHVPSSKPPSPVFLSNSLPIIYVGGSRFQISVRLHCGNKLL